MTAGSILSDTFTGVSDEFIKETRKQYSCNLIYYQWTVNTYCETSVRVFIEFECVPSWSNMTRSETTSIKFSYFILRCTKDFYKITSNTIH